VPIQTTVQKNNLATAYGVNATHAAVYTTAAGATAGTEPGAPYARKPIAWGAASNGVITGTVTFDIAAGVTLVAGGVHTALTAGTYLDGGAVTSQLFATAGTYTLTLTYTQA
jgi:energy-converting hydrogenase Eha subunit C